MKLVIDGSHMRATDLQYLIIREAIWTGGLTLDPEDRETYARAARDYPENVSGLSDSDAEALGYLEDYALEALNDSGGSWWVAASCLWFEKYTEDEATEQQAAYDDTWPRG